VVSTCSGWYSVVIAAPLALAPQLGPLLACTALVRAMLLLVVLLSLLYNRTCLWLHWLLI
jgi:hypothetical protein